MTGLARVTVQRRVEWPDTDAARHYHHSTVIRWVEAAEAVLYERLGLVELFGEIPRVRYEVDYRARLWFGDLVDVTVAIGSVGRSSVRYDFDVRRGAEVAATGTMTAVRINQGTGDTLGWSDEVRTLFTTSGELAPELLGPSAPPGRH